jgi:hypothetical protein
VYVCLCVCVYVCVCVCVCVCVNRLRWERCYAALTSFGCVSYTEERVLGVTARTAEERLDAAKDAVRLMQGEWVKCRRTNHRICMCVCACVFGGWHGCLMDECSV